MSFFSEYKKVIPINFSASLSYYLVLSLVPSFLLIYLFSGYLLNDFVIIEEIIKLIFPSKYSEELIIFLNKEHLKVSPYLLIIVIFCVNIISNGINNLSKSINMIFKLKQKNNMKIKSILSTFLLILLEGIMLYIGTFINYLFNVFIYLRFLILNCIVFFSFVFIYKFLPSIPFKIKDIINYSIIGAFLISILILGFNIFIDYYSRMSMYYGSFSIIVSVLILFKLISDIISFIFFLQYKKLNKEILLRKS